MTSLVPGSLRDDPVGVTDRERADGPPYFGMPENSPFTIEGRIERADALADHAIRVRDGRERPVRDTNFASGLWLISAGFGALILVLVVLYLLG